MLRHLWQSRLYLHCSTAYHQPLSAILQKYFSKLKMLDSGTTSKGWIFPTNGNFCNFVYDKITNEELKKISNFQEFDLQGETYFLAKMIQVKLINV